MLTALQPMTLPLEPWRGVFAGTPSFKAPAIWRRLTLCAMAEPEQSALPRDEVAPTDDAAEPPVASPSAGAETPDADSDLISRAVTGDRHAFEALVRRHYDRIHRVAWRQTGSIHEAEDIAQDVLCRLLERLGEFRGESRFTTWLIGMTINACRDHRRRRSGFLRMREAFAAMASLADRPDGRDLYRRSWLRSLLGALKPDLRETVVLVAGEALSHAEAARELGISEQTVAWRMHQARKQLKQYRSGSSNTVRRKETRDER
jgi:RNA polymerase sigma-70 factor (ECF subfamily)